MAEFVVNGSSLGNPLADLLTAQEIVPGDAPSYQLCKTIFSYHPLGLKMAESPIAMAQSQKREISIPDSPEERVKEAFEREWEALGADRHIFNTMRLARVYGIASVALKAEGVPTDRPIDFKELPNLKIAFSTFDPLNTSGSLVLNQNPNDIDFQRTTSITVSGQKYHPSRSCIVMNEDPIFIEYTVSAFGYVGRSVYQRALYPLKSFVQSMVTDDLVALKAGVLVAKIDQPGSIIDNAMAKLFGQKRQVVKEARSGNVISVGKDEAIENLTFRNIGESYEIVRKNILENIAVSADMPAKLLNSETFAEGFGEGTEDAKHVARYIDRLRVQMQPLYDFFTPIAQYRAWNPEFYKTIQAEFDEYKKIGHNEAFYRWRNSFTAMWPSLLTEPDSEKIKVEDVKLRAAIALVEVLLPAIDPENKARLIEWVQDNFNSLKMLFDSPLQLDFTALESYEPPQPIKSEEPAPPFSQRDAQPRDGMVSYDAAVASLAALAEGRKRKSA